MSENTRIFPRYLTRSMKIEIKAEGFDTERLQVENVSLGGLRVSSNKPVKFTPELTLSLVLGSQEFNLKAYTVWNQAIHENDEETLFNYGFRLVFNKEDNYRRWLTFMRALHQHQKNLATKNS